jgi:hypothetical protein
MKAWIFLASYMLLSIALSDVFRPARAWLPQDLAIGICVAVAGGWLLFIRRFFKTELLTPRQKVAGWLGVAAVACLFAPRTFLRYHALGYWPPWPIWLGGSCACLVVSATLVVIAARILPKKVLGPRTAFTPESEAPDHVIVLARAPDRLLDDVVTTTAARESSKPDSK